MIERNTLSNKMKKLIALATVGTVLLTTGIQTNATLIESKESTQNVNTQKSTTKLRNVMYYGDWSVWGGQENHVPAEIPVDQLTHLNFAFMDFDERGNLAWCDKDAAFGKPVNPGAPVSWGDLNAGVVPAIQQLKYENPNLKIGVSVGGWSKTVNFPIVTKDPTSRKNFTDQLMKFIEYNNMDFLDIDWEFPGEARDPDLVDNKNDTGNIYGGPEDKQLFVTLLQDLRTGLDELGKKNNKYYELSIATHPSKAKVDKGIDVPKVFDLIDFCNIMSYDMRGAWDDNAGHQTGLYTNPNDPFKGTGLSIDETVKNYIALGAPSDKLVIGAGFYTRGWEKVTGGLDPKNPGLFGEAAQITKDADGTPARGGKNEAPLKSGDGGRMSGVWSYRSIDKLKQEYPGLKEYWDDSAKAPYLYDPNGGAFFTYDNPRSIAEKGKYVLENNLGGMIGWMASQDKPTTSKIRDELTKAMKQSLFGNEELPKYEVTVPGLEMKGSVTASKEQWGSGGLLNVNVKNEATLKESNEVLAMSELNFKTFKNPKIYVKTNGVRITGGEYPAGIVTQQGGYYVVDLSLQDITKFMKPGANNTFVLKTDKDITGLKGIEEIFITQRMYKDSNEYGKVVLYTNNPTYEIEDVNKDGVVDILDLSAVALKYNMKKDKQGFDTKYDINKDEIIDMFDLVMVSKKIVSGGTTPEPEPEPTPDPNVKAWDPNGIYKVGQRVSYDGKIYECRQAYGPNPAWNPKDAHGIWVQVN